MRRCWRVGSECPGVTFGGLTTCHSTQFWGLSKYHIFHPCFMRNTLNALTSGVSHRPTIMEIKFRQLSMEIQPTKESQSCQSDTKMYYLDRPYIDMTKCVKPLRHLVRLSAKSSRSTNQNAPFGRLSTLLVAECLSGFKHFVMKLRSYSRVVPYLTGGHHHVPAHGGPRGKSPNHEGV
jgi:hypothetical protein